MSTSYQEVFNQLLNQIQCLEPHEQLRLLEELSAIVQRQLTPRPKHNVMEFQGMAKKFWEGVDVDKYIDEERNSWQ